MEVMMKIKIITIGLEEVTKYYDLLQRKIVVRITWIGLYLEEFNQSIPITSR